MADDTNLDEIKKQCIFCHIVAGRVASKKVFEDDKITAILDINPANPGHILLMPKEHYAIMPQIPDDIIGHLGMTSKALSAALLRAFKAQGTTIFVANGVAAGQRAQHFMMHVIPRMENDGIGITLPQRKINDDKLSEIKKALIPSIKNLLGKAVEETNESKKEEKQETKKETSKEQKKLTKETDLDEIARILGT
ncbi:HIT domain-containing protein [Candidatus Woesearchaeota archaeon]|nr:HIT domain-containing protein [Candidatus Woesearchaeota archaeon]